VLLAPVFYNNNVSRCKTVAVSRFIQLPGVIAKAGTVFNVSVCLESRNQKVVLETCLVVWSVWTVISVVASILS